MLSFKDKLSFSRLHPQNVLGVRSFADQYMCSGLVESANKYLQKHFKDVVKTEEFLALKMTDVIDILGRDELNVHSEEQVLALNIGQPIWKGYLSHR